MPEPISPHADTVPSDASGIRKQEPVDDLVGTRLGHFRVDAPLGRGGMGTVYRAWDASLERDVALKVLLGATDSARERFLREARVQAKLRHPNVVPIHFVGVQGEVSFLVMDIVDGESLADVLAREGSLSETRALDVADAIASALAAGSEAGLVHRDVKPSNILIDKTGRIMLADFGLAKTLKDAAAPPAGAPPSSESSDTGSAALTRAGAILGTPAYIAPEQARGENVDLRADMYALGATLYEALTGQPPFTAPSVSALLLQHLSTPPIAPRVLTPTLRPAVDALVLRLLEKKPEARFATYADLHAAIAAARPTNATPATFFVRFVAFVIDLVCMALAMGAVVLVVKARALTSGHHSATVNDTSVFWLAAMVGLGWLERAWSTPGKKLMRLRVEGVRGERPSLLRFVLRSLTRYWGVLGAAIASDLLPEPTGGRVGAALVTVWLVLLVAGAKWRVPQDRVARTREVFL